MSVTGLTVGFERDAGAVTVVDDLSLTLANGEMVALLGESGCGKSVTSLAIMGLAKAARIGGSIRLEGEELHGASAARRRDLRGRKMAMIFQNPATALNPLMTIGAQVAESVRRRGVLDRREVRKETVRLLGEVQIRDPERRFSSYPHMFSGGMCQRVMIAMAIAGDPLLLIADEPTAALDVTVQRQIMDLLDALRRRRGTAILFITHDLGLASVYADRVAVMYSGQIVEDAPSAEVFAAPAHPYTRGLIDAIPDLDGESARFSTIPGTLPDLAALPPGCRFAARCAHVQADCHAAVPPLRAIAPRRQVRCFHPLYSEAEA